MVGCLEEYDQVSELYETSGPQAPTKSRVKSSERHPFILFFLNIIGEFGRMKMEKFIK